MGTFESFDGFVDHEQLVRAFGATTVARGSEYAARGAVDRLNVTRGGPHVVVLHGRVEGSGDRSYDTYVTVVDDPEGLWLDSRCTCPVVRMCKHGVAVALAAIEEEAESGRAQPVWERRIARILEELDDQAVTARSPRRPLALQVELAPARAGARHAWDPSAAPSSTRGPLRLRPLQRGARDNWVKTNVSWVDVPGLDLRHEFDPAQVSVLAELLTAYRTANRHSYYGGESHLLVPTFGPSLWPLLTEARRAGLPLVPAGPLQAVTVAEEPVSLQVDVNGAGGDQAHLGLGVWREGEWYGGDRVEVLGSSGHGLALWSPAAHGWEVVLARLDRPAGAETRRFLSSGHTLAVPREDLEGLVADYLPRLRRHLPVGSSDASVTVPEVVEPRLTLTVTWKAADEVHVAWSWRYRVGADDRIYSLEETRGLRGVRRPDAEAALLERLELTEEQEHRLCRPGGRRSLVPEQSFTGYAAVAFTEETLLPLEASGQVEIEEIGARPTYRESTELPVIRFDPRYGGEGEAGDPVDRRTDWLDLEVVVTIEGHAIALSQLLEALTLGAERIVLGNGLHLRIDRPEFAQLAELVRTARDLEEQPRDGVRVNKGDLGLWDELAELGIVTAQASQWVEAARAVRDVGGLPEVEPVGVRAELRSYQLEGFRWLAFLWRARLGGILADDMGLGKTLQTLALVALARSEAEPAGPFLVVAPTSVVPTWAQEAAAFTPGLRVRTVTESRSRRGAPLSAVHADADLVITSYTLFRLEADEYAALEWGGLVLDEAQTVKNHTGKTHQSIRRLDVPFRLALTGTPMENRLMELWSLLSIVAPGLYPYPDRFAEAVANPVEKEDDRQVLARFQRRIRPFLLRRTKDLVAADLPPKQEQVLEVRLTPRHRKVYETHLHRERQRVLGLLDDFDRQRVAIFSSLTKLRQLSLDAALVDPALDGVGSAKIDVLVDHLQELASEGHRALVFSQFTSFLTRVRARLDAEGIASTYLDGRTRRRAEVVQGFKRGDASVFLISLKAGGVGLTLTEADYVFVLDPWWNPAVEAQAVDRAHRIGQRRPVIVYRLVSSDTIEEKVMALKARKAALFAKVLDGSGAAGAPIVAEDIRALLAD